MFKVIAVVVAPLIANVALAQGPIHLLTGADGENLGSTVTYSDVDADGLMDVVAGAPFAFLDTSQSGRVRVFSGRTGSPLLSVTATARDLGFDLAGGFDLDGDGRDDFAAGAPGINTSFPTTPVGPGFVGVYSGATGAALRQWSGPSNDGFGIAVAAGPDVDLDGVPDVAVGASQGGLGSNAPGYVRILSGASGTTLLTFTGTGAQSLFGSTVRLLADADGDGVGDVAVGAPNGGNGGTLAGRVDVYSGAGGTLLMRRDGALAGEGFGYGLTSPGDLDGDGRDDLVLAAPGGAGPSGSGGAAHAVRAIDGAPLFSVFGNTGEALGVVVAALGDANGDGIGDFVTSESVDVSTMRLSLRSGAGGARFASILQPAILQSQFAWATYDALAAAGDTNGDAIPDLAIGRWQDNAVDVHSSTCGAITSGLPLCPSASPPVLSLSGCAVGGGELVVAIASGAPAGIALLIAGLTPAAVPLQGGCILGVAPVVTLPLSLDGAGQALIVADLPLPLGSATMLVQALVQDPATPATIDATNLVTVVLP